MMDVGEYRKLVEDAYGPKSYSTTRRARLYRKLFGRWPQRVVDERLFAVQYAEIIARTQGRGLGS